MLFLENAALEIALIALAITLVLNLLQSRIMGPRHEMKASQEKMNQRQKRLVELQKKNPEHPQLKELQEEIVKEMQPMMKSMMIYMVLTLVAVLPLFQFLGETYNGVTIDVPVLGKLDWFWWYMLTGVVIGVTVNKAQDAMHAKKEVKEKK